MSYNVITKPMSIKTSSGYFAWIADIKARESPFSYCSGVNLSVSAIVQS